MFSRLQLRQMSLARFQAAENKRSHIAKGQQKPQNISIAAAYKFESINTRKY